MRLPRNELFTLARPFPGMPRYVMPVDCSCTAMSGMVLGAKNRFCFCRAFSVQNLLTVAWRRSLLVTGAVQSAIHRLRGSEYTYSVDSGASVALALLGQSQYRVESDVNPILFFELACHVRRTVLQLRVCWPEKYGSRLVSGLVVPLVGAPSF